MRIQQFLLLIPLCLCCKIKCEVAVFPVQGNPIIADTIEVQNETSVVVKIYNGFKKTIPKAAVSKIDDHNKDYAEFKAPEKARAGSASAPAPLTAARRTEITELITSYFAAGADRAKILAEIKKHDEIPWSDVAAISQSIFTAARNGLKVKEGTQTFECPGIKGEVHIEVLPSKDPKAKLPVFLILHGGGENMGSWDTDGPRFIAMIKKKWSEGIFVCPSVMHKKYAEWGGNPEEEVYCKELMKAVSARGMLTPIGSISADIRWAVTEPGTSADTKPISSPHSWPAPAEF